MATKPSKHPWYVYVARCSDDSLYTGIAKNVKKRLAQHNHGRGARYTRGRTPLSLCASRRCRDKSEALRLEYAVKRLSRARKEELLIGRRLGTFARQLVASRFH